MIGFLNVRECIVLGSFQGSLGSSIFP